MFTLLQPTFYTKLDPEYCQKLIQLEDIMFEHVRNMGKNEDKEYSYNAAVDFLNQFMMPKEFWTNTFGASNPERPFSIITKLIKTSVYQFYYEAQYPNFMNAIEKKVLACKNSKMTSDISIGHLCIPHKNLEIYFDLYEKQQSFSLIPKSILQVHEKMKILYSQMKAAKFDSVKWFKVLTEVGDHEFVEYKVERRLGRDLTDKMLWKLYLKYLKLHNKEKLLQTYAKYCRFFLNDSDMKEEYRNTVGDIKVAVPWKNVFDFEVYDEKFFNKKPEKEKKISAAAKKSSPIMCYFNDENALSQKFPFKATFMHYIIQNANAYVFHNLYKSCKWFYLHNPIVVCYKLVIRNGKSKKIHINEQSILMRSRCSSFPSNFQKLFITTHLNINASITTPNIISHIYRCTAKYISIDNELFSDKELQHLLNHGNVVELRLWQVRHSKNKYFILHNIVIMLPKIKKLEIDGVKCTAQTAQLLCEIPFENKIKFFAVTSIQDTVLESKAFAEFVVKNISPKGEVVLKFFSFDGKEEFIRNFKETAETYIDQNWKDEIKPKLMIH